MAEEARVYSLKREKTYFLTGINTSLHIISVGMNRAAEHTTTLADISSLILTVIVIPRSRVDQNGQAVFIVIIIRVSFNSKLKLQIIFSI